MARSPNYPAHGLSEAIGFAKQVYEKEKKTEVSGVDIAKALGLYKPQWERALKDRFNEEVRTAGGDENQGMRIADLAVRILFPSGDAIEDRDYRKQAALMPNLFQYLYDEKREGSDESIRNFLVTRQDFTPDGAKQAVDSFRDTMAFSGLDGNSYNASETSERREAKVESTSTVADRPDVVLRAMSITRGKSDSHSWTWTLSIPRSVNAELLISGPVERRDIERLVRHLDALKEAFDEDSEAAQ